MTTCHHHTSSGHTQNVFFFLVCTVVSSAIAAKTPVNCYLKDDILQQQKACFTDEGIDISLPSTNLKVSEEQRKTDLLNSLIENEPEMLCRQKEAFKKALPCTMDRARECMPTDYQDFLPDPNSMTMAVDKLCNNDTAINFACVKDMGSRLFDCSLRRGKEAFKDIRKEISAKVVLCKAFELSIACQKEIFPECGCETTRVYTDIFIDYIYPPACPPIGRIHGHVICNEKDYLVQNKSFSEAAATRHQTHSTGSVLSVSLVSLFVFILMRCVFE